METLQIGTTQDEKKYGDEEKSEKKFYTNQIFGDEEEIIEKNNKDILRHIDKIDSNFKSQCRCSFTDSKVQLATFVLSIFFIVIILVLGVVIPVVLYKTFKDAEDLNSATIGDIIYTEPDKTIIIMHSFFYVFFLIMSLLLLFFACGKLKSNCQKAALYCFVAFLGAMWIAYSAVSGVSKEVKATKKIYTPNEVYIAIDDIKALRPYFHFGFIAYHEEERSRTYVDSDGEEHTEYYWVTVVTKTYEDIEYSSSWSDTIVLDQVPEELEALLIETKPEIIWDDDSMKHISEIRSLMTTTCYLYDVSCSFIHEFIIEGLPEFFLFASDRAQSMINNHLAILSSTFWQGLSYSLTIDAKAPTKITKIEKHATFY